MPSDPHISIQMGGKDTVVEFPSEGIATSAVVEALGGGQFRFRTVPLFVESASFLDIIEADVAADGTLIFKRVLKPSGWRVFSFVLSRDFISCGKLKPVLARAEQLGAYWERVFGGVLFVCVPPEVAWDPSAELAG